ncbi:hypothetical protein AHAS_Ahas13G0279100 [Arachis hypogaea]
MGRDIWSDIQTHTYVFSKCSFSHPLLSQFGPNSPYDFLLSGLHPGDSFVFSPQPLYTTEPELGSPFDIQPIYPEWFVPIPEPLISVESVLDYIPLEPMLDYYPLKPMDAQFSSVSLAGIRWKRKDPAAAHGFGGGGSDEKAVMVEERAMAKEVR